MQNHENTRVLSRLGARELTVDETRQVTGAQIVDTNNCTLFTLTLTEAAMATGARTSIMTLTRS